MGGERSAFVDHPRIFINSYTSCSLSTDSNSYLTNRGKKPQNFRGNDYTYFHTELQGKRKFKNLLTCNRNVHMVPRAMALNQGKT